MSSGPAPDTRNEEFWHKMLTEGGDTFKTVGRHVFMRIPSEPRCRMCAAPFGGGGGRVMRVFGKRQSEANPNWCTSCTDMLSKHHGGAEVDGALLFADIRGSTTLAEGMSPGEYHALLDRFYTTATKTVFDNDGYVDKFVGDELVALFFPLLAGERYVERAVDTAKALLRATGHEDPGGPWVPVGAGVHSGRAWFGAVGEGTHVELTALGDVVNVAARLASQAESGEIIVSVAAAEAAGLDPALERTSLDLKGRQLATEVVRIRLDGDRGSR